MSCSRGQSRTNPAVRKGWQPSGSAVEDRTRSGIRHDPCEKRGMQGMIHTRKHEKLVAGSGKCS